ncbi:MAG: RDD family protein [Actinobacteria bacterium]|nr:RDD family protein [Actinomycetota bacterium]
MSNGDGDDRTHYDVIGVDPDASKEDIRAAYRDRLEELAEDVGTSDDARAETARLNGAWQVLSDPYQRERYDDSEGIDTDAEDRADDEDEDDGDGDDGDEGRAPARRQRPARDRARGRDDAAAQRISLFSAEPVDTPPTWPAGFRPPPPRARVIAMVIDLAVLFVLVLTVQTVGARVIDSVYEEQTHSRDVLGDRINQAEDVKERAENRAEAAEEDIERAKRDGDDAALEQARAEKLAADDEIDRQERIIDGKEDRIADLESELVPAQLALTGAILVLALLYLVPSSVVSGRTLGKQLLGIRVINADGTRLGLRGALYHYGAPVLVALMFSPILGQLVVFIVLIGVLTWPRNPNRQGLHDRLAGTLVVDG